jgi:hypothetical protein
MNKLLYKTLTSIFSRLEKAHTQYMLSKQRFMEVDLCKDCDHFYR